MRPSIWQRLALAFGFGYGIAALITGEEGASILSGVWFAACFVMSHIQEAGNESRQKL